jgi:hypothetical protein
MSPPLFSDVSDNPLGVSLPTGVDGLRYAAGAAFANALLAVALGVLLHLIHVAKQRWSRLHGQLGSCLDIIPAARFPGSIADHFSTLVQPSSAACVALFASSHRTTGSVVCGAMMAAVWLAYPGYCAYCILLRGRRQHVFLLQGIPTRTSRRLSRDHLFHYATPGEALRLCLQFASSPTQVWRPRRLHRGTKELQVSHFLVREMRSVFDAFVDKREWYFMVEWGVNIVSGAALGAALSVAESAALASDVCSAAQWGTGSAIALSALHIVLLIVLQPASVRCELWMGTLLGLLELLANILVVVGDEDSAENVVAASAVLEMAVVVILSVLLSLTSVHHIHHQGGIEAAQSVTITPAAPWHRPKNRRQQQTKTPQCKADTVLNKATPIRKATCQQQLHSLINIICVAAQKKQSKFATVA